MARKKTTEDRSAEHRSAGVDTPDQPGNARRSAKPSALLDTRVIYCGDNLEHLKKLPPTCVDLIYIDPPFNSNRNYEVFWGETKEKRAFEDRHESEPVSISWTGSALCFPLLWTRSFRIVFRNRSFTSARKPPRLIPLRSSTSLPFPS